MSPTEARPDNVAPRPLPVLRAMIDALDHELLHHLARRNELIGEIARFKREHGLHIRDPGREREILGDRSDRGMRLGLSPQVIESLFRLILWGSRDRQAALKAELPLRVEPKTVAVIGGNGAMGRCMLNLFRDLGHAVMPADLDTPLSPDEAAATADVVIISVPIAQTVEVIRRLGPRVRPDALLMDVTSVKEAPVAAMLESSQAAVVGTHPLFAPSVHSLQGQRVVLCQGRGTQWYEWLVRMFRARGLVIKESTPAEHDRAMSVVQVLVHFSTEVMGRALSRLGISVEQTLEFTSPIYLMELIMTARHFAQSSQLYGGIQMSNPAAPDVCNAFLETAEELRRVIVEHDEAAFAEMFDQVRDFFGPFTHQALEHSSFLIDRLVERT